MGIRVLYGTTPGKYESVIPLLKTSHSHEAV